MEEFGAWVRHKIRVIVIKQWKTPKTIYRNLCYLNQKNKNGFDHEAIYKVANSRLVKVYKYAFETESDEYYERFEISRELKQKCIAASNGHKYY